MGSGELHVLMGDPKGPHIVSSKVIVVAEKIQTAVERSRQTIQDTIMLTLFFTCDVTGRINNVKLYWFTVANFLPRNITLPNKMEFYKHKYLRRNLEVASCQVIRNKNRHVMSCNSEILEKFAFDDLWWPHFWPHIKMIFILSLGLVNTYRVVSFPLDDALHSFRVSREGRICALHPAVRRWFRPPAVRGLTIFLAGGAWEVPP